MRQADEGRYDDARQTLESAAEGLRKLAPNSSRAAELIEEAERLDVHTLAMTGPAYSSTVRKRMSNESWRRSRGRRRKCLSFSTIKLSELRAER